MSTDPWVQTFQVGLLLGMILGVGMGVALFVKMWQSLAGGEGAWLRALIALLNSVLLVMTVALSGLAGGVVALLLARIFWGLTVLFGWVVGW